MRGRGIRQVRSTALGFVALSARCAVAVAASGRLLDTVLSWPLVVDSEH